MLTRETALARLRNTGTLAAGKIPANLLTRDQVSDATMHRVQRVITSDIHHVGRRLLAPAAAHGVLP